MLTGWRVIPFYHSPAYLHIEWQVPHEYGSTRIVHRGLPVLQQPVDPHVAAVHQLHVGFHRLLRSFLVMEHHVSILRRPGFV